MDSAHVDWAHWVLAARSKALTIFVSLDCIVGIHYLTRSKIACGALLTVASMMLLYSADDAKWSLQSQTASPIQLTYELMTVLLPVPPWSPILLFSAIASHKLIQLSQYIGSFPPIFRVLNILSRTSTKAPQDFIFVYISFTICHTVSLTYMMTV